MKKIISFITAATIVLGSIFVSFTDNVYAADVSQRDAVVEFALSQEGYVDTYKGDNVYLKWAGAQQGSAYCAAFATYCFSQAGLKASQYGGRTVQTSCPDFVTDLGEQFKPVGTYIPKKGDLIFYDRYDAWDRYGYPNNTADHVGIVISCDSKTIKTIEGNVSGGKVAQRSVQIDNWAVFGFGAISYNDTVLRGDLNGDGKITITDVVKYQQFLAAYNNETVDMDLYDCTEDGSIDNNDLEALRLYSIGKISSMKNYTAQAKGRKAVIKTALVGKNRTEYVLDVYGGFSDPETLITAYPRHDGNNQIFELIPSKYSGYYYIKASYADLYWNVNFNQASSKYQKLQLYSLSKDSSNMLFKFSKNRNGYKITTYYGATLVYDNTGSVYACTEKIPFSHYTSFYIEYTD